MKHGILSLLVLVATTLLLIACDDKSNDLKTISKFKDLTPPCFSGMISHQDDISEEWSQADYLSGLTLQVLCTRQPPSDCKDGSYYYFVDIREETVQPPINTPCIVDSIELEYQGVTDPYTKEKYFEYAHDGKLMRQLLILSNPDNQEQNNGKGDKGDDIFTKSVYAGGCTAREL